MMNGHNGHRPYYRRRMNWNSLFIGIATAGILWMCKLILAGVMYLVNTLPMMQADVNTLKHDVAELKVAQVAAKQELKVAADTAQHELIEAEKRVTNEFKEQLKKQPKPRYVTPD